MRRIAALAVIAVAVGSVVVATVPASAEIDGIYDPQGDAPAFPDVTSLEIHNHDPELVVKAIVPGFDPDRLTYPNKPLAGGDDWTGLSLRIQVRGVDGTRWTPTWKHTLGRFMVDIGPGGATNPVDDMLMSRQRGSTTGDVPCPGMHTELTAGMITATIPQSCFGRVLGKGGGAVQIKAAMRGNVGPMSTEDRTMTTPWVHKATE